MDPSYAQYAYVTHEDLKQLNFSSKKQGLPESTDDQNLLLAIQTPHGSLLNIFQTKEMIAGQNSNNNPNGQNQNGGSMLNPNFHTPDMTVKGGAVQVGNNNQTGLGNNQIGVNGSLIPDDEYSELMGYLKERYHLVIDAESAQKQPGTKGGPGHNEEPITVYQIETKQIPPNLPQQQHHAASHTNPHLDQHQHHGGQHTTNMANNGNHNQHHNSNHVDTRHHNHHLGNPSSLQHHQGVAQTPGPQPHFSQPHHLRSSAGGDNLNNGTFDSVIFSNNHQPTIPQPGVQGPRSTSDSVGQAIHRKNQQPNGFPNNHAQNINHGHPLHASLHGNNSHERGTGPVSSAVNPHLNQMRPAMSPHPRNFTPLIRDHNYQQAGGVFGSSGRDAVPTVGQNNQGTNGNHHSMLPHNQHQQVDQHLQGGHHQMSHHAGQASASNIMQTPQHHHQVHANAGVDTAGAYDDDYIGHGGHPFNEGHHNNGNSLLNRSIVAGPSGVSAPTVGRGALLKGNNHLQSVGDQFNGNGQQHVNSNIRRVGREVDDTENQHEAGVPGELSDENNLTDMLGGGMIHAGIMGNVANGQGPIGPRQERADSTNIAAMRGGTASYNMGSVIPMNGHNPSYHPILQQQQRRSVKSKQKPSVSQLQEQQLEHGQHQSDSGAEGSNEQNGNQ